MATFTDFHSKRLSLLSSAEDAETSTHNDVVFRELTDEEKLSGDYEHGSIDLSMYGLPYVHVENPKGSTRVGINREWLSYQPAHYGYFEGTLGADGDPIDVYVGSKPDSDLVLVVNMFTVTPNTGSFDEHKVIIGFDSYVDAKKCITDAFDVDYEINSNWVRVLSQSELIKWLSEGDHTQPCEAGISYAAFIDIST